MLKFVIILAIIYIGYKMFANDLLRKRKQDEKEQKEETDRKIAAGEMVKDPECGVYVAMDDSVSVKDGNRTWYFCSYECRDKFLKKIDGGSGTH